MIKASYRRAVQQVLENHQTRLEQKDRGSRGIAPRGKAKPMEYLMRLNACKGDNAIAESVI